jgi:hypothetical protein
MWTVAALSAIGLCGTLNAAQAPTPNLPNVPEVYKYDAAWPKPLPNNWPMGTVTGMSVDQDDHIWVLDRPSNDHAGKPAAPGVLEFDVDGNLLRSWGTADSAPPGVWPKAEHTIFVDREHNVWLGGAAPGDTLLKFTMDGKFLSDFGHRGPVVARATQKMDNQETTLLLAGAAGAALDEDAKEIYIADGYLNRRVIVLDMNTGAFMRGWGAYGKPLSEISNDPQKPHDPNDLHAADFKSPVHCVHISNDGLVYVCDRGGDRIQVFTKQGKFLKEFHVANATMGGGSAGSVDFSSDKAQKYIFVADLVNGTVWQLDRQSGTILGHISHKGPNAGELDRPHVSAMDSKGNVYVGEIGPHERVQKFLPVK